MDINRESMKFDVLFVGGGPASLAGAIRLAQLAEEKGEDIEIAIIEKGAEIGSHALSGAVFDPACLKELIPDFIEKGCPIETEVRGDKFFFLTRKKCFPVPFMPKQMHNKGFYIISLAKFTKWLGGIAEETGVNIFTGFAGSEALFSEDQKSVKGVRTDDKGTGADGRPKSNFEPGINLMADVTVFGEGARGSLAKQIDKTMNISEGKMPQAFELGIKEVIKFSAGNFFSGKGYNDIHIMGYPLSLDIPGGAFIYEMKDDMISIGMLTGLSYKDAVLDPYDNFIKFKRHPFVADIIRGGKVIEQGARTVSVGGFYSVPQLTVNGAAFIGGCASMHSAPALKGIHISMKSGMTAAGAIIRAVKEKNFSGKTLGRYYNIDAGGPIRDELWEGRNFCQALSRKGIMKFIHLGAQRFTKGRGIEDKMPLEDDSETLEPAAGETKKKQEEKKYDNVLYVDKLTGVYLSKTMHREDQPCHIVIHDEKICVNECFATYNCPCTRFCPGNVYEIETDKNAQNPRLKLNPSNCLHCKTCDIKDPCKNITWTCPEGGGGPGYTVA